MEESVTVLKLMSEILPDFIFLVCTPTIYQMLYLLPFVCAHTFQIYNFTEDSVLKLMSYILPDLFLSYVHLLWGCYD